MGEKSVEFQTSLGVKECGMRFKSGIENGRGASAWIGGVTAKLMGGETLSWYTPQDDSPFAALDDDPPTFGIGVGVPKAQGAHANGTNVHMYVWDRGSHRDVALWAHHSLTGGSHAARLPVPRWRHLRRRGHLLALDERTSIVANVDILLNRDLGLWAFVDRRQIFDLRPSLVQILGEGLGRHRWSWGAPKRPLFCNETRTTAFLRRITSTSSGPWVSFPRCARLISSNFRSG